MSSAPVPPAPEMIVAKAAKEAARPPYVKVPSITNPKLTAIPDLDQFLQLCDGEKIVKSWRIRVRKPKLHMWWLAVSFLVALMVMAFLLYDYRQYRHEMSASYDSPPMGHTDFDKPWEKKSESLPNDWEDDKSRSTLPTVPYDDSQIREIPNPSTEPSPDGLRFDVPPPEPTPGFRDPESDLKTPDLPPEFSPGLRNVRWDGGPPIQARVVTSPLLGRVIRDGDFWRSPLPLLVTLIFLFPPGCVLLVYILSLRGHTFLYLTNRRLVVVELEQNIFHREQTVLNYTLENISGFTLHTQRGLKKLFALILLKEKRTFYMAIVTRTLAQFALGGMNTWGSRYQPGLDAVALCAELDALVLGLKAGLPANRTT